MNEKMDNCSQILQQFPTLDASSSSDQFGGTDPFKVKANFDIPIFKDQINVDALEKWLNLVEGYFSIHNFYNREKKRVHPLKLSLISRIGERITTSKGPQSKSQCLQSYPLGDALSLMLLRNNITLFKATITST